MTADADGRDLGGRPLRPPGHARSSWTATLSLARWARARPWPDRPQAPPGKSTLVRAAGRLLPPPRRDRCDCAAAAIRTVRRGVSRARSRWSRPDEAAPRPSPSRNRRASAAIPIRGALRAFTAEDDAAVARASRVRVSNRSPTVPLATLSAGERQLARPRARAGAGAGHPAPRRACRAPEHRAPAPAVPRARRGAPGGRQACWPSSTTFRGPPPGPSGSYCFQEAGSSEEVRPRRSLAVTGRSRGLRGGHSRGTPGRPARIPLRREALSRG